MTRWTLWILIVTIDASKANQSSAVIVIVVSVFFWGCEYRVDQFSDYTVMG